MSTLFLEHHDYLLSMQYTLFSDNITDKFTERYIWAGVHCDVCDPSAQGSLTAWRSQTAYNRRTLKCRSSSRHSLEIPWLSSPRSCVRLYIPLHARLRHSHTTDQLRETGLHFYKDKHKCPFLCFTINTMPMSSTRTALNVHRYITYVWLNNQI